jgi:3-oxoacyl-[acyl-carrier-protein] synthase-3
MPSLACELHQQLGLQRNIPAFDLNMACSGYVYGLWVAASLRVPRCLLVVGDTISRFLDPVDASTYPIFGDAVSATTIELVGGNTRIDFVGGTDGGGAESLKIERCVGNDRLIMDGSAVFNFAVSTVPGLVAETSYNAFTDWFLFHQANKMMVEHIAKKASLDMARVPMNIAKDGNTSSASIPLLMCDSAATAHLRSHMSTVCMFGFGAGLSWGGVRVELDPLTLSLLEV